MEIEVLSAALVLVASVCGGMCAVFIARSKSTVNKHSRQRIKDFENDIQYLAESKKQEAKEYRQEILRLKSSVNRIKDGATVTETDMKNSGLGEVIMQLIPKKYQKAASFLVPQVVAGETDVNRPKVDVIPKCSRRSFPLRKASKSSK